MSTLIEGPTRILFFTGKGGVGKTSAACATAIGLADSGRKVLLVSTDPASNLDEVLRVKLSATPTAVPSVPGLSALNIDPEQAAHDYRERVVGPYRGVLPAAAVASIEEQLSGACTVEIAAFDEFSKLLGDKTATAAFDHVIFDTAPTGHTLRLLELPAAWSTFIDANVGGTSCLGPLSGLNAQKALYAASNEALRDPAQTTLVLVARPDRSSLAEAERTRRELAQLGVSNVRLILNGVFQARDTSDATAVAMEARGRASLDALPSGLRVLARVDVPLLPFGLVGIDALRKMGTLAEGPGVAAAVVATDDFQGQHLDALIDELAKQGHGVVMTMGKGGVGKTTVAARIASALSRRGFPVTLTTTDPAAHVEAAALELSAGGTSQLRVTRIDPALETRRYTEEVLAASGEGLDAQGRALLEEDLRSPCTEEIAVFRAFAETVAQGEDRFVVIDTAPTGHTLLLLDAAESYHREVLRKPSGSPEAVQRLLPRLRDPGFTHVLLVTLPEATPIHEAMQLERDLARADIKPFAWVVNQSLTPLSVTDPVLRSRRAHEATHLRELVGHCPRIVLEPWSVSYAPGAAVSAPSTDALLP
ncbi:MAG: arsenical pump-driving ATPase [Deltaproteobacteria bacterium]|nr:arsenical pump-driving ATPase [Myxococcales bacterium]MDP3218106.1 arsenical pump-driving ATPase [Deltaproteobacteria bacterium]